MNKEIIREYVGLLMQNASVIRQYQSLIGDDLPIYDVIYNTEQFAAKALGIPEDEIDTIYEIVLTWVYNTFPVFDENEDEIKDINELINYIYRIIGGI